jgi:hypothetical protein
MEVEFHRASQVCMAWTRGSQGAASIVLVRNVLNRKSFLPIGPIPVFDAQSDRRADGLPMANPGKGLDAILFDLLSAASPVAELPAMQLALNEFKINGHTRRHAADPRNQRLTVRLTRSDKAKHGRRRILSDPARRVKQGNRGSMVRAKGCIRPDAAPLGNFQWLKTTNPD